MEAWEVYDELRSRHEREIMEINKSKAEKMIERLEEARLIMKQMELLCEQLEKELRGTYDDSSSAA